MKKGKAVILIVSLMVFLCACGQTTDVDKNTIIVDKKGSITEAIVEDFSQPYYDSDELKSEIETKISTYNAGSTAEEAVKLDKFDLSDSTMKVNITFKSYSDYTAFNEKELFSGTVSEAYSAGYEFPDMKDVLQEGVTITSADVLEKGDMHMLVLEEAQQVMTFGKITYISDGVSLVDEKTAVNLNEGQRAFIIYE